MIGPALALLLAGAARAGGPAASPHGRPDRCDSCHQPAEHGAAPDAIRFAGGSAEAACRSCHERFPHQVGMMAHRAGEVGRDGGRQDGEAEVPPTFPLVDGRLSCLTCHDEPACDGGGIDPADRRFFRDGPYPSLGALCSRCHGDEGLSRYDPHRAMEQAGDSTGPCEFCHAEVPVVQGSGQDLKVLAPRICQGCHDHTRHAGTHAHLVALEPGMARRARAAGLPLAEGGQVFCGTCHDPHPAGSTPASEERRAIRGRELLPPGWDDQVEGPELARRSRDLGSPMDLIHTEPDYLRLPLAGGALCLACHEAREIDRRRAAERRR